MSAIGKNEGAAPWPASAPSIKNDNLYAPSIQTSLDISNLEAAQFLSFIAEGESITFQTFDDLKERKDPHLIRVLHGNLEEHLPMLARLNKAGAGIFFTVNATDLKGREKQNITKVRAVFVDLDGAPLGPVLSSPLSPHIVVESSAQRYHAYWLLDALPLEHFSLVQKALIKRFDADGSVHDLPRVMRLPGFFHRKSEPILVRVIERTEMQPYHSADFLRAFQIDLSSADDAPNNPRLGVFHDPVLQGLDKRGMIKQPLPNKPGAWEILCPFVNLHTTGDQGTAYFEPHTNGYKGAGFKCMHAHCDSKGIEDLRKFLGLNEEWPDPVPLVEELLAVMPFPAEILPSPLHPWIMDIADRMQVPLDFVATATMVVLGALIGRKFGIFPKAHDDWLVIPNLWGAIVGRPSLLKSPAIAEIMKLLEKLVARAIEKYEKELKNFELSEMWVEAQKAAQKEALRKAARNAAKNKSTVPELTALKSDPQPKFKRYKTEDGTVEKIGEILAENPQGILIHRDELVGWLKNLDKYGREGDRAFFLESWNGNGSYTVDRIGRGTLHIPALCLSIIGGIQPGPLSAYVHQAVSGGSGDDGLLQRFQLLVWPDTPKIWKNIDRVPDRTARDQAYDIFCRIDAFEPSEPSFGVDFETWKLRFEPDAQHLFNEWRVNLEAKLRSGELSPALESHLAKYRSLMPALALISYLVRTVGMGADPTAVDLESASKAIRWCEYLETHAKRLYACGEDPGMESARALLDRIQRGDLPNEFSPRDVYHAKHWSKLDTADQVTNAIKLLEEFGWVKSVSVPTAGRPSVRIILHPQIRRQK